MFLKKTKVLQISFIAILSAFGVEFTFGVISNSLGLITDSVHALLDSIVTVILLIAAKMSIKPPDKEHTYGHGKIESLGGLFGGIAIFLIAIFFIYESIHRLQSPHPTILPGLFAIVGGIYTIGVDVFRIILLNHSLKKIGGTTLKADFYHAFMDLGSTLVAICGIILVTYGFYQGDFIAALILGIVLVILSLKLIYKTSMELTDIISPEMVQQLSLIAKNTDGVIDANQILMRRSGDTIFAEVTILIKGDSSFDEAHEISNRVESNIKKKITNCNVTIHFEPSWEDVPIDSKIYDLTKSVKGVKEVHNVNSHKANGRIFVSLHVMVDNKINLYSAHRISEEVEKIISKTYTEIEHVTIHLEPFVSTGLKEISSDPKESGKVNKILMEYQEIKKISKILSFDLEDIKKIEIDCSFDRDLSIEKVHDIISDIEKKIRDEIKNAIVVIHPEPA